MPFSDISFISISFIRIKTVYFVTSKVHARWTNFINGGPFKVPLFVFGDGGITGFVLLAHSTMRNYFMKLNQKMLQRNSNLNQGDFGNTL